MTPQINCPSILKLIGIAMLPLSSFGSVILFQQGFDSAVGDTNQTIYAGNSNAGGTAPTIVTNPGTTGLSGKGLRFTGSSANSLIAANFQAVTLSSPGDYISFSFNYAASANPTGSGTNRIGLYNSGSTLIDGNMFATANQSSDDIGYIVAKNLTNPLPTSDVSFSKMTASAGGLPNPTLTLINQSNSGITGVDTTAHSVSLRLTVAANGTDVDMLYTYDGYSKTTTIAGASLLTMTFDEFTLAPGFGSSTTMYVDNLLVMTNIPEPSSSAVVTSLAALGVVGLGRHFRSRRLVA